jgi:hypothetical protein
MGVFTWDQVNAWRLRRHFLLERADRSALLDVVTRLGGVHAQLMSAAELILWARMEHLAAEDVQNALWQERVLVKTWAMRGTLHLLTREDFARQVAARSTLKARRPPSWFTYHGVTPDDLTAILVGVPATVGAQPLTREQLADAVAKRADKPHLREVLRSGWGALLKPAAFRGELCFGPNQGQNVTFVRPVAWLGDWEIGEIEGALAEIAQHFLGVYGPATVDEFARWFGCEPGDAKRAFRALDDAVVEVTVAGWQAWALTSSLEAMQTTESVHVVRLLPYFDPYTLAVARHAHFLLPAAYKGRIYRPQGWIAPVVLVDGQLAGVWEYEQKRTQVRIEVELFAPPTVTLKQGLEAEAARLGDFLGTGVEISYST